MVSRHRPPARRAASASLAFSWVPVIILCLLSALAAAFALVPSVGRLGAQVVVPQNAGFPNVAVQPCIIDGVTTHRNYIQAGNPIKIVISGPCDPISIVAHSNFADAKIDSPFSGTVGSFTVNRAGNIITIAGSTPDSAVLRVGKESLFLVEIVPANDPQVTGYCCDSQIAKQGGVCRPIGPNDPSCSNGKMSFPVGAQVQNAVSDYCNEQCETHVCCIPAGGAQGARCDSTLNVTQQSCEQQAHGMWVNANMCNSIVQNNCQTARAISVCKPTSPVQNPQPKYNVQGACVSAPPDVVSWPAYDASYYTDTIATCEDDCGYYYCVGEGQLDASGNAHNPLARTCKNAPMVIPTQRHPACLAQRDPHGYLPNEAYAGGLTLYPPFCDALSLVDQDAIVKKVMHSPNDQGVLNDAYDQLWGRVVVKSKDWFDGAFGKLADCAAVCTPIVPPTNIPYPLIPQNSPSSKSSSSSSSHSSNFSSAHILPTLPPAPPSLVPPGPGH